MNKKRIKSILVIILILVSISIFSRNILCRLLIEKFAARTTGLKLSIESFNLNILDNSLSMRGVTLFNPPDFKNRVLGKAKEIFIIYDLLAFLSGVIHLPVVKAEIDEINIIRNKDNNFNISAFKRKKSNAETPEKIKMTDVIQQKSIRPGLKKQLRFLVGKLEFSIRKVTFMDHKAGRGQQALIIFKAKAKEPLVFKNISNLSHVIDRISTEDRFRTFLDNLYY